MDNLSRYGREECGGHVGFNAKHTGMEAAAGGVPRVSTPVFNKVHGSKSPLAARRRRCHRLLEDVKPATEGQEPPW